MNNHWRSHHEPASGQIILPTAGLLALLVLRTFLLRRLASCTASMKKSFRAQKFNDDLLPDRQDQATARQAFPLVFDVLDHEELRHLFSAYNDPADHAKRRSLRAGIISVMLVVIALFGTSADRLYEDYPYAKWISIGSTLLSLIGVAIGLGGLMIWKSKKEWLYQRMVSERLRQFHFQTFVCRIDDIAKSLRGECERSNLIEQRNSWS
jgi:hypothetical protein